MYVGYIDKKTGKGIKDISRERNLETKRENYELDCELRRLRKEINQKQAEIAKERGFIWGTSILKDRPEGAEKHPLEEDIEKIAQRVREIDMEKRIRASERNARRELED